MTLFVFVPTKGLKILALSDSSNALSSHCWTTKPVAAVVSAGLGITIAIVARDPSVKVAFYPPRERGSVFPIPPELAPHEILEAADVDEKGKRR